MKMPIALAMLTAALLTSPLASAAGPFEGTWKTRLESMQFSNPPDVYELKDGLFACGNCAPAFQVAADGSDHPVSGHSYYDSVAVTVVDARTVQLSDKLAGRTMYEMTLRVSPDGKSLSEVFKDLSGAKQATWNQISSRVANGAAGSHAIAGSWKVDKMPGASEVATTISYRMSDDGLQMYYNGMSYDAKFDGKPVLTVNDPGKTWVSLKRMSALVIEETDTRGGKVTDQTRMSVSPDGKVMTVVDKSLESDSTMSFTMDKLP